MCDSSTKVARARTHQVWTAAKQYSAMVLSDAIRHQSATTKLSSAAN